MPARARWRAPLPRAFSRRAQYVVLANGEDVPTAAMVSTAVAASGVYTDADGDSITAEAYGTITLSAADTEYTDDITGLDGSTPYDVYVVLVDGGGTESSPTKRELTTVDDVAPTFPTGFPSVQAIGSAGFEVDVQSSEPGTAYVLVLAASATAPTDAEVKASVSAAEAHESVTITSAQVTYTATISGLTDSTAYDVYVVLEDASANLGNQASALSVTTLDSTPPTISGDLATPAAGTTITLEVDCNEDATVYAAVLQTGSASAPTSTQLRAGIQWYSGNAPDLGMATFSCESSNDPGVSHTFTGLQSETSYTVYFVTQDAAGNLGASPSQLSQTTADITAPVFTSTTALGGVVATPVVDSVTAESYQLLVELSEPATVYYVANSISESQPSAADIISPLGKYMCENFAVASASTPVTFTVEGTVSDPSSDSSCDDSVTDGSQCTDCPQVLGEQAHVVWLVAVDASNNIGSVARVDVVTLDGTPPTTIASSVDNIRGHDAVITVSANEASTAYVLAVPRDSTAPTSAQVKAGVAYGDVELPTDGTFFSGSFLITTPTTSATYDTVTREWSGQEDSFTIRSLTEAFSYDLYVALEDRPNYITSEGELNLQASPSKLEFATTDTTPSVVAYAEVEEVTGTTITYNVSATEAGTVYFVAIPIASLTAANIPSGAQVKAATDGLGNSISISGSFSVDGQDEYVDETITGLTSETAYAFFFAAEDEVCCGCCGHHARACLCARTLPQRPRPRPACAHQSRGQHASAIVVKPPR